MPALDFGTEPSRYRHLRVETDGPVARIVLATDEGAGVRPGYDLGVDIELHDAVQRHRA